MPKKIYKQSINMLGDNQNISTDNAYIVDAAKPE